MSKTKICSKCHIEKSFSEYTKRYDRPIGVRPWCKQCQRKIDAATRKTEHGKSKYRTQMWKKSGIDITYEEYKKRYDRLEGCCEICKEEFDALCVDHNHSTGKIRGLICTPCNLAIDHLKESPDIMNNAIDYIKFYGGDNV